MPAVVLPLSYVNDEVDLQLPPVPVIFVIAQASVLFVCRVCSLLSDVRWALQDGQIFLRQVEWQHRGQSHIHFDKFLPYTSPSHLPSHHRTVLPINISLTPAPD